MATINYVVNTTNGVPVINQVVSDDDGNVVSTTGADLATALKVQPDLGDSWLAALQSYAAELTSQDKTKFGSNEYMNYGRALSNVGNSFIVYGSILAQA